MKQTNLQASSTPDLIELFITGDQKNRQLKNDGHTFSTLSKLITDVGRSCKMKPKKNKGKGRIDKGSNSFKSRFAGLASKSGNLFLGNDGNGDEVSQSKGEGTNFSCSEDELGNGLGLGLRKCKSQDDLSFFHTGNFSTSQEDIDMNNLDNTNDGYGVDLLSGGAGTKKTTDVSTWLLMNYERTSDDSAIARMDLYQHYKNSCTDRGKTPVCQATFGKSIRLVFPGMRDRRLGIRGKSRYHYCGIRPYLSIELKLQVARSLRKNLDNIINQYEKELLNKQYNVAKNASPGGLQQTFSSMYTRESDGGYVNSSTIDESIYAILSRQQIDMSTQDSSAYSSPSSGDSAIISSTGSKTSLTCNKPMKIEPGSTNSNSVVSGNAVNENNSRDFYLSTSSTAPKTGMARVIDISQNYPLPQSRVVNVLKSDNKVMKADNHNIVLGTSKNSNGLEVDNGSFNNKNAIGTFDQHHQQHNHDHNRHQMDINNSQTRGRTISSTSSSQLKQFHLNGICSPMYVEHENNKSATISHVQDLLVHDPTDHQHNNISPLVNGQLGVSPNLDLDLYCMNGLTNPTSNLSQTNSFDYLSILESGNSVNNIPISHTSITHAVATKRNHQLSNQTQIERGSSAMMTS